MKNFVYFYINVNFFDLIILRYERIKREEIIIIMGGLECGIVG